MKKNLLGVSLLIISVLSLVSLRYTEGGEFSEIKKSDFLAFSLEDVLVKIGKEKSNHNIDNIDKDSVKMGYEMVVYGQLKDKSNKRISKFFVCTDCHNQVREVAILSNETADERINYGIKNDIPYLPASTFYGLYNKEHWYNGDYATKYGGLVKPTRDTLSNAIQLCAVQCSQGRSMEEWEIRSVLHYLKSIEIKVADLNLPMDKLDILKRAYESDKANNFDKYFSDYQTYYSTINNATFGDLHPTEPENYKPNLENGKYIFDNGCLHCHGMGKDITNFEFDTDKLTFSFLESKLEKQNHFTVPYIVRKGTYAVSGRKQYMPQYPLEKMSDSQLFDLINYIKAESKK
jgi:mono/diheme cytochrome c family protein